MDFNERSETGRAALDATGQLGYLCKDVDLYRLIEKTGFGKSVIGSQMDQTGRWLFNHRFGGGHLWWKELSNRPATEWPDVVRHLASDLFTPQGIPYAVDGTHLKGSPLLKRFLQPTAHDNWLMLNGFDVIAGASALSFTILEATRTLRAYRSDFSFATDNVFVGLTFASGLATANPLLIIAAAVKLSTVLRRTQQELRFKSGSVFDLDVGALLDLPPPPGLDIDALLRLPVPIECRTAGGLEVLRPSLGEIRDLSKA